jgi:hypothetical protein
MSSPDTWHALTCGPVGPWRAICDLGGALLCYTSRDTVLVGGLMSYGTDVADMVSVYTGVILRGARPVDLAVLQPTKFAFVLNKQRERLTPKTRSVFITMR